MKIEGRTEAKKFDKKESGSICTAPDSFITMVNEQDDHMLNKCLYNNLLVLACHFCIDDTSFSVNLQKNQELESLLNNLLYVK